MNDWDFVFDDNPLNRLLDTLQPGQILSGVQLLTAAEAESEVSLNMSLDVLAEKGIVLDISGLEIPAAGAQSADRLQMEEAFVKAGMVLDMLDSTDPLRLYLEELAAIPVCGDTCLLAETVSKANQAVDEPGDDHTRLAELSLGRVVELAGQYAGRGVLLLDLIQEGSMALWQAVEAFVDEPCKFEAYCDEKIRFAMVRQILLQAKASGVGQMLRRAMEDYRQVDEKLLTELGRNPEPEELAQALHLTVQQTVLLSQLVENTRKLGKTVQPEPEELPQEEDQAVEDTAYFQMRQRISELLSRLSPEDARLITMRYGLEGGLPMKPQQVAARMGITPEQVVQREAAALSKLRENK